LLAELFNLRGRFRLMRHPAHGQMIFLEGQLAQGIIKPPGV